MTKRRLQQMKDLARKLPRKSSEGLFLRWSDVLELLKQAPASMLDSAVMIYDDTTQESSSVMQVRVIDPDNPEDMDNFDVDYGTPLLVLDSQ